jgi:hypothetical protein
MLCSLVLCVTRLMMDEQRGSNFTVLQECFLSALEKVKCGELTLEEAAQRLSAQNISSFVYAFALSSVSEIYEDHLFGEWFICSLVWQSRSRGQVKPLLYHPGTMSSR